MSTVQSILRAEGLARLDVGDRVTNREPVRRYQRDRPGELIRVDIKKIAGIPDGGGWRIHGKGNDGHHGHAGVGYRYIHTAIDDRTRLAYSELLTGERAETAAGFWAEPKRGSPRSTFAASESSPTTGPAIALGYGTKPVNEPEPL